MRCIDSRLTIFVLGNRIKEKQRDEYDMSLLFNWISALEINITLLSQPCMVLVFLGSGEETAVRVIWEAYRNDFRDTDPRLNNNLSLQHLSNSLLQDQTGLKLLPNQLGFNRCRQRKTTGLWTWWKCLSRGTKSPHATTLVWRSSRICMNRKLSTKYPKPVLLPWPQTDARPGPAESLRDWDCSLHHSRGADAEPLVQVL